jgi:hypothetical protein
MPDKQVVSLVIEGWQLVASGVSALIALVALFVAFYRTRHVKRSADAAKDSAAAATRSAGASERSAAAAEVSAEHARQWADIEARKRKAEQAAECLEALIGFKNAMLRITDNYRRFKKDQSGAAPGNIQIKEWVNEFEPERETWFRWQEKARTWFGDPTYLAVERVTGRATNILVAMRQPTMDAVVGGWQAYADHPHKSEFLTAVVDAKDALRSHLLL